MKKLMCAIVVTLVVASTPLLAHHAAESVVDEEIYAMIDAMVADTPHALMTIEDLGGEMTEMVIDTQNVRSLELMIDDGLLTYLSMLDGGVEIVIDLSTSGALMTVTQYPVN